MFLSTWGSYGIGDVVFILSNFFTGGADDQARDAEVQAWLAVADTSSDPAERQALYARVVAKIADAAYWLPLYDFNIHYGLSKDLAFTPHPDEFARFWLATWN